MANTSSGPYLPGHTTDLVPELRRILEPLRVQTFQIDSWTKEELVRNFMPVKVFIKAVKHFTLIPDESVRRSVVHTAITKKNMFQSADVCDCIQFYDFCIWLKTAEGRDVLNAAWKTRKLEKQALPGQFVADVALLVLFNLQRAEYKQAVKETKAKYDARIQELQKQVALTQQAMEDDLRNIPVS